MRGLLRYLMTAAAVIILSPLARAADAPLHVLVRDLTAEGELKPPNPVVITGHVTGVEGTAPLDSLAPWKPVAGTVSDGSGTLAVSGLAPNLPIGAIISVTGAWDGTALLASSWEAVTADSTHRWTSTIQPAPEEFRSVTLYGAYSIPQKVVARGSLVWRWEELPAYAFIIYGGPDGAWAGTSESQANGWVLQPDRVELDITIGGGETVRRTFVAAP